MWINENYFSKRAFEAYSKKLGIDLQHYRCKDGRFINNLLHGDIINKRQSISHCGVNAHFQDGLAEKRISNLQDYARKSLIHAKTRWPAAITSN